MRAQDVIQTFCVVTVAVSKVTGVPLSLYPVPSSLEASISIEHFLCEVIRVLVSDDL